MVVGGAMEQVAGQQGAYVARMINRGYRLGTGGLEKPFPARWKEKSAREVCSTLVVPLQTCYAQSQYRIWRMKLLQMFGSICALGS